ncbi:conserved hypothetical protein [Candidatus Competibacter denitrificans Run_A_D11]|uniref:DUF1963 domain-containing protein n=1 Tax=Candidatus Competibacter denitrificans Run_A_D11 TaxID=1400863 RepID=W6MBN3_9GAMM|nr:DUF1963 domain-containing protein [Candidatus Competibacter denitrificans]CDI03570.1 conserved hypothetical protein [Candidatus Competibacter denitrificans Run_A_D11]HAS86446.1 DUF1963 domain-containing protein [Candidatus Competibacteraceae bacterium]HRC70459.1 DUF1963 domain-containing protein [Candidatus Competibacter denitrificans]
MGISYHIEFVHSAKPITGKATKFGGQPNWVIEPQWPLSRLTGNPMCFIAQIELVAPHFSDGEGQMAYLFMTDEEDICVDGTWDAESGENAVIIQPGVYAGSTAPIEIGPSLYQMVEKPNQDYLERDMVEYAVKLHLQKEPDFQSEEIRSEWALEEYDQYQQALEGNKIGGAPLFLQSDEFPEGSDWKLLLQLDSGKVPFYVNFGDAGIGYAFVNPKGTVGKFLWQCA